MCVLWRARVSQSCRSNHACLRRRICSRRAESSQWSSLDLKSFVAALLMNEPVDMNRWHIELHVRLFHKGLQFHLEILQGVVFLIGAYVLYISLTDLPTVILL